MGSLTPLRTLKDPPEPFPEFKSGLTCVLANFFNRFLTALSVLFHGFLGFLDETDQPVWRGN